MLCHYQRICTKPKIVASFQQIEQAWDLREQALLIAESALGYSLPRVPTTIDVYKPTTPSLRTFVDGVEPGVNIVHLFCNMIATPTGHVQVLMENTENNALGGVITHTTAPSPKPVEQACQPAKVEVQHLATSSTGVALTPEADRSNSTNLYVSPSPQSAAIWPNPTETKSENQQQTPTQSLAQYCASSSSEDSEEIEGGWSPEQMQHDEEPSGLFDISYSNQMDAKTPIKHCPSAGAGIEAFLTNDCSTSQQDIDLDHSTDEESDLFIGLEPNSPVYE